MCRKLELYHSRKCSVQTRDSHDLWDFEGSRFFENLDVSREFARLDQSLQKLPIPTEYFPIVSDIFLKPGIVKGPRELREEAAYCHFVAEEVPRFLLGASLQEGISKLLNNVCLLAIASAPFLQLQGERVK